MNRIATYRNIAFGLIIAIALVAIGCTGGTGDPNTNEDFAGTEFVATESTVGTLNLSVNSTTLSVGETSGFSAVVRNASGQPVSQIQVSCDTEAGLALIEPTTGAELTDNFGLMSGVVGCAAPGSFQLGCRLPIGGNKRKFVGMLCEGPVPAGFAGFGDTAGGGIGTGGVAVPDDGGEPGGVGTDAVRITEIAVSDTGEITDTSSSTTAIDITQGLCGDPPDQDPEPFFDSHVALKIVNNSNVAIRFTKLRYSVENVTSTGDKFNSQDIGLIGDTTSALDPNGGENTFWALLFDANSGGKRFIGSGSNIAFNGVRNITLRAEGTTELGDTVIVSGRIALSFDNFDRCNS